MKRIVLDARYIADHFPGIGRYVYNLARSLGEVAPPYRVLILHNPAIPNSRFSIDSLGKHETIELVPISAQPFSIRQQWQIPQLLRRLNADVYHAPYYVRPYVALPCPTITTLYDAIPRLFPGEVSLRARFLFDALTRLAARSSCRIITISQSARDDLVGAYGFDSSRIAVTPLAADERFCPQPPEAIRQLRAKYMLPERYVLSLASNKPHKNLLALIEAYSLLGSNAPALVLAGHWNAHSDKLQKRAAELGVASQVHFLPNVADADLPALYAGAEVFVYPSRYEGFGLPPLEALAVGVPVVCGNHSSLPEVVGNAALRVDVAMPAAIAEGVTKVLDDLVLRDALRLRGLQQAARFSWRKTAEQTLQIYEQCL